MKLYLWDETGAPAGSIERDETDPLPPRSTRTKPPAPKAKHSVQWRAGWTQVPNEIPDLLSLKAQLREAATARRWQVETGGLTLSGVRVATGLQDQNRIASVLAAAQVTDLRSVDFKAESGWVQLSVEELQAIAAAVTAHVQAGFTAERAHHEAIGALTTVAAAQAYDVTANWPLDRPQDA